MKNLLMYLIFISITIFCIVGAFKMDIPTDNQIGLLFFSCFSMAILIMMSVHDVKNLIRKR